MKTPQDPNNENLDDDFLTEPLVGLCSKPLHTMTEEEALAQVALINQLRASYQTLKAEIEHAESPKVVSRKSRTIKKVSSSAIDDLLE